MSGMRVLIRGATPIVLAVGAVSVLSTAAWANPTNTATTPTPAPTSVALTALPAWGYGNPDHHGSREDCIRHGGREWWDGSRQRWYCRGGSHDGWWW